METNNCLEKKLTLINRGEFCSKNAISVLLCVSNTLHKVKLRDIFRCKVDLQRINRLYFFTMATICVIIKVFKRKNQSVFFFILI
jgi:hypothetical protein